MRKFRFQFEAVEKVRKSREDEALRGLATAQRAHRAALDHRQRLIDDMSASLARREALGHEPVPSTAFQLESEFIAGSKIRIAQAGQAVLRAQRAVEKALRAYLQARRQTKMIETLREKAHSEFRAAARKREARELDELYVMRARIKGVAE
jgi:flagellar export protein FliJ